MVYGMTRLSICFVCRLLQYSVEEAQRVIAPPLTAISAFAEEQSPELRDRIFEEFNTLAVIYREPSAAFTRRATTDGLPNGLDALVRPIFALGCGNLQACRRASCEKDLAAACGQHQGCISSEAAHCACSSHCPPWVCFWFVRAVRALQEEEEAAPRAQPAVDEGSSLLSDYEQAEAQGQDLATPRLANGGASGPPCHLLLPCASTPAAVIPSTCHSCMLTLHVTVSPASILFSSAHVIFHLPSAHQRATEMAVRYAECACCAGHSPSPAASAASAAAAPPDLLDPLADLLGGPIATPAPPQPPPPPTLTLRSHPQLSPPEFQSKWGALQPAVKETVALPAASLAAAVAGNLQVWSRWPASHLTEINARIEQLLDTAVATTHRPAHRCDIQVDIFESLPHPGHQCAIKAASCSRRSSWTRCKPRPQFLYRKPG